uniref:Translocon-associated protein subunit delta n=1 Tax=Phallusia mammillata TaxID=59560 RepID=A0A6F9DT54_9ASCI|nr:translocon-associated protein subunit delta-like [Phallusia mammillata]
MGFQRLINFAFIFVLFGGATANTCVQPTPSFSHYTSNNEKLSQSSAVVVEFTLKCKNKVDDLLLFADVEGTQIPVTKSPEGNNFQVSWTSSSLVQARKMYKVRFFDEEGYSNLRKAIRSSQDINSVKELFQVEFKHPGLSSKLWIRSELLALIVATIVFYVVCKERSEVIA